MFEVSLRLRVVNHVKPGVLLLLSLDFALPLYLHCPSKFTTVASQQTAESSLGIITWHLALFCCQGKIIVS